VKRGKTLSQLVAKNNYYFHARGRIDYAGSMVSHAAVDEIHHEGTKGTKRVRTVRRITTTNQFYGKWFLVKRPLLASYLFPSRSVTYR
jgi:hypothetical protein